jgi:hypothetical protein
MTRIVALALPLQAPASEATEGRADRGAGGRHQTARRGAECYCAMTPRTSYSKRKAGIVVHMNRLDGKVALISGATRDIGG